MGKRGFVVVARGLAVTGCYQVLFSGEGAREHETNRVGRKGFTLVELLVVMAIISVLAAFLLPALKNAMDSARAASCQSQLRQWYFILNRYVDDYDGCFTSAYDRTKDGFPCVIGATWLRFMSPYAEGATDYKGPHDVWARLEGGILRCPAYPAGHDSLQVSGNRSYGLNSGVGYNNHRAVHGCVALPHRHTQRPARIVRASTTFLMTETECFAAQSEPGDPIRRRHMGKLNFLFVDGHSDGMDPARIYVGSTAPDWRDIWRNHWLPCFDQEPCHFW